MEPRDIIRRNTDPWEDEDPLIVLIDTPSMNEQISYGNEAVTRLLQYHEHPFFKFIRTPESARYSEIQEIQSYSFEAENGHKLIRFNPQCTIGFPYQEDDVQDIAGRVFEDKKEEIEAEVNPTKTQVETVRKVFIQASINRSETGELFVTDQDIFLSNRRWFENHFPGRQLNLMTLDDAIEYLGLYSRFREEYPIQPRVRLNTMGWYWSLFRTLVPRFHVESDTDDQYLRGFGTRVQNLLIAADEIGYQYFQKPDNRTELNIGYHFDHAISLITGTFDSLALKTTVLLEIDDIEKESVSLSNNRGRRFLREVREKNSDLRDHISDHMPFINLIYTFRPLIVHRGGYQSTYFQSDDEEWTGGMITLDQLSDDYREQFFRYYREIEDEPCPYDPITKWGYYESNAFELLEPYHFIKMATKELVLFSNEYLRLLEYNDFFEEIRAEDETSDFLCRCEHLQKNALTKFYQEMR